jgi:hypothetical protein
VFAHLTQVGIVEPPQVRVVDAIGVDVGVRREGWLVAPVNGGIEPSAGRCAPKEVIG